MSIYRDAANLVAEEEILPLDTSILSVGRAPRGVPSNLSFTVKAFANFSPGLGSPWASARGESFALWQPWEDAPYLQKTETPEKVVAIT